MPAPGPAPRLESIDLLRGMAILLILPVNLPAFALPEYAAFWLRGEAAPALADFAAFVFTNFFIQGKIYPILALLFGVGAWFAFQRRGSGGAAVVVWLHRLLVLGLLGVLHVVLLFSGDILIDYAFCALFLIVLPRLSPTLIPVLGGAFLLMPLGFSLHMHWTSDGLPAHPGKVVMMAEGHEPGQALLDHWEEEWERDRTWREGTWMELARQRTALWIESHKFFFRFHWWEITGWMLIGYSLAHFRFFHDPGAWRPFLLGVLPLLAALAIPLQTFLTLYRVHLIDAHGIVYLGIDHLAPILMTLLYVGMFLLVAPILLRHLPIARSLAGAGRMSLSLYILQSVLLSLLFRPYGLGWYDTLNYGALLGLALLLWAALFVLWEAWGRLFGHGPLEALLAVLGAKSRHRAHQLTE